MEQTQEKGFLQRNMKWLVVLAVLVVLAFWAVGIKNGFVKSNESITAQWSQVETSTKGNFDLIPNIVNTVKGSSSGDSGFHCYC
jgi:LemA protein